MKNLKELIQHQCVSKAKDFETLKESISKNINGRICHHNVKILNLLVDLYDIKTYLEIGVHNGTSMSYIVHQNKSVECIGIDLFESTTKQYKPDDLLIERTTINIESNNKGNSTISFITGNSQNKETISKLESKIKEESIDLLFIDGDHSYQGIKLDFNNYTKFVKPGGFIVIDDYNKRWPDIIKFCDNEIDTTKFEKIGLFFNNELLIKKL